MSMLSCDYSTCTFANENTSIDEIKIACNCRATINMPVLKAMKDKGNAHQELISGYLDYLRMSKHPLPSIDQPGHRECVYARTLK